MNKECIPMVCEELKITFGNDIEFEDCEIDYYGCTLYRISVFEINGR